MSQAASQASAFYHEVAKQGRLWTIKDSVGFPAPRNSSGKRAQPFWSSLARAQRIIANVPAYRDFEPHELAWSEFCERWLPGLTRDGILVGVNWSGTRAVGYDVSPAEVVANVEAARSE